MAHKVIVTKLPSNNVNITEESVRVTTIGIQGPPGGGDKHYTHSQAQPNNVWTIVHNLEKHPSVVSVDTGERQIIGAVEYVDKNVLTIEFSGAVAGKAYLN